jgi:hypothetical protein
MVAFCMKAMLRAVAVRVWAAASTRTVRWSLARVRDWASWVARTSAAEVGTERRKKRRTPTTREGVGVIACRLWGGGVGGVKGARDLLTEVSKPGRRAGEEGVGWTSGEGEAAVTSGWCR